MAASIIMVDKMQREHKTTKTTPYSVIDSCGHFVCSLGLFYTLMYVRYKERQHARVGWPSLLFCDKFRSKIYQKYSIKEINYSVERGFISSPAHSPSCFCNSKSHLVGSKVVKPQRVSKKRKRLKIGIQTHDGSTPSQQKKTVPRRYPSTLFLCDLARPKHFSLLSSCILLVHTGSSLFYTTLGESFPAAGPSSLARGVYRTFPSQPELSNWAVVALYAVIGLLFLLTFSCQRQDSLTAIPSNGCSPRKMPIPAHLYSSFCSAEFVSSDLLALAICLPLKNNKQKNKVYGVRCNSSGGAKRHLFRIGPDKPGPGSKHGNMEPGYQRMQ